MRITQKHIVLALSFTAISWLVMRRPQDAPPGVLSKAASLITQPLQLLTHAITPTLSGKPSYAQLTHAYKKLQHDHEELIWQYVADAAAQQLIRKTKSLRAFGDRYYPANYTLAQVIEVTQEPERGLVALDKGSQHGIEPGMLALYKRGLVGTVTVVYPYRCIVKPITDPSSSIAAITAHTGTEGICAGAGNTCTLDFVNHLQTLQEGEIVLSSGKGGIVPHGYALGKIATQSQANMYKIVRVTPIIELSSLEYCVLIAGTSTQKQ